MKLVQRRRLVNRFDERLAVRITLLEAGAGYGKSTLVRQVTEHSALLQQARDVVVRCRQSDSSNGDAAELLASIGKVLEVPPTIESIADGILAASPDRTAIWIDDVHNLDGDPRWLAALIDALPHNGHVVLVGRHMPSIPVLRLEAQGQVLRITEDELRFDDDERAAFAHLRGRSELTSDADGWPALMELESSVGRVGAVGYLVEEVLGEMTSERRAALRRLTHLDQFDESLVHDTTDFTGSLTDLIDGLPLVHTDVESNDVRITTMHDLLVDALRVDETATERTQNVAAVAAALFERGDTAGAARRFASLGDLDGVRAVAGSLIADLNFAADVTDRLDVVELASTTLGSDVTALTLRALTSTIADPAAADAALSEALDAARRTRRTDFEARLLLSASELAYSQSRSDDLQQHATRLAELADSGEPLAARVAFLPDLYLRRITGRTGQIPDVVDELIAADALVDDEMRAVALFFRTVSLAYTGRVREALEEADRHGALFPPGLFSDRIGGFLATQRWMLGELDIATLDDTARLVDRIEQRGQMQLFVEGAASTSIFNATSGRIELARDLLRRAEIEQEQLQDHAWTRHSVAQAQAVLAVLDGDEDRAARLLDAAMPDDGPIAGLPNHVYLHTAALSYVLVPRSRAAWDSSPVAPDLALRTQVGKALVAFRECGDPALAALLPWDQPHRIRPWAIEPHLVELVVAAIAGGAPDAAQALTDLHVDPFDVLDRLADEADPAVSKAVTQALKLTPRRPAASLDIGVLGPLSITRNNTEEVDGTAWRKAKVTDLLLLLVRKRSITRADAGLALWPEKSRDAGQNNLRVNLSLLLKALEPDRAGPGPSWFVRTDGDLLRLETSEALRIDVDTFRNHIARGKLLDTSSPRLALPAYISACELYRGDYLDGASLDDNGYYEALHLRGEFVSAATRAADLLLAIGNVDHAESLAMAASEAEPLNESSMRVLAAALLAQRRLGAATEVLTSLIQHLAEVQIPLEPETRALATRLRIIQP
ncbi:MAG: BTAD domain-containing putative transcriptional regulator [Ilumatobacter sp.]